MLLTLTTTHTPATDLGYLLHKHPARCQSFDLAFGQAHVFYPEASDERCTAALLLDVDPLYLTRREHGGSGGLPLEPYVNDRPYVVSSFLSVAIAQVFGSALAGRSKQHPDLAATALPIQAQLAVLPCRDADGETLVRRLFEPLGYHVEVQPHALDDQNEPWGMSPYVSLHLQATIRLHELLSHLYVLIPVLDDQKHYWVGEEEVEKLLRHGESWLAHHPEHVTIASRYLRHVHRLTSTALAQLTDDHPPEAGPAGIRAKGGEAILNTFLRLRDQRYQAVLDVLIEGGARRVLDLGCGEGEFLRHLLDHPRFIQIAGMDVSYATLQRAHKRLHLDQLSTRQRERIELFQGSLVYRDKRLIGYDAATLIEVIEHLDLVSLSSLEHVLFVEAHPEIIILTTPNIEYNARFPGLAAGTFRHHDHRFEWNRNEFQSWARNVAQRCGYTVMFRSIGAEDPEVGPPTQMGIFRRHEHHYS